MARQTAGLILLLLIAAVSSGGQAPRHLKPQPNLPIDCADYAQPCTGTQCVTQWASYSCQSTGENFDCPNDTQNYVGGNSICCVQKAACYRCPYNGKTIVYYAYLGDTIKSCAPNP